MCIICTENDAVKSLFIGSRINLDFFLSILKNLNTFFFKYFFFQIFRSKYFMAVKHSLFVRMTTF